MMMRLLVAAAIALGIPATQPDAARVLADMRQALGGDAAIAAVQAFSVSGTESHNFGGRVTSARIEWTAVLPDSFVRVSRTSTPRHSDVTASGFRGDARIQRRESDMPPPPDLFPNDTPVQRAARDARRVRTLKHEFSRLAIALIGIPAVDPLDASYEAQQSVDGRLCDVLRLRGSDGYTATLAVDSSTHLPVMVSWMGVVTVLSSSVVTVASPRGQLPATMPVPPSPPSFPAGDPSANGALVEYQLFFEDFKLANGLNWPHRFVEKTGGRVWTTTHVGKFKLNPKIDQKLFDPVHP